MKKVLLIISGSIACYKAIDIISILKKQNISVKVILTNGAKKFITPLLCESISGNPVPEDTFIEMEKGKIQHIELARWADLVAVVPATANIIGKIANGISDDLASSTIMASSKKKLIIAPAMNTDMYESPITQKNISIIKKYLNADFIEPASGMLACGAIGKGKLANTKEISKFILEKVQ